MFRAMDVSTSGLVAQRLRMTTVSNNLANLNTTRNERGEPVPYQERFVVFQTDQSVGGENAPGVQVSSVETSKRPPIYRYEPWHPDAIKQGPNKGKVAYPAINMMTEMTDAMEAARSYEANLGAIDISKSMQTQTLRILA